MTAGPQDFDPTRPVAAGTTVLEASAGTGKTHAVASLVVAEVAAGRPIDQLLVVTFTRKATGTLRERVWERLVGAGRSLAPGWDGHTLGAPDALLDHLATGDPTLVALRRDRILRALAAFDTASIETIHGFCQKMLGTLGLAGDAERELTVVEEVDGLVAEAVDDLFVRRFHTGEKDVLFDRSVAGAIARSVVRNPGAVLAPVDDSVTARLRRQFARTLRDRIEEQKRHDRLLTYDDILGRLAASIADPDHGRVGIARVRRQYSMAVVDEFQDTDATQWSIFQAAFGDAPQRLVLVGDPKQAIYAFRGGDVHAYLAATATAGATLGLRTSWRSDGPLLGALEAYFAGAELGDPSITHRPVAPRPGAEQPRLVGAGAPLTVRIVDRATTSGLDPGKGVVKKQGRELIAADVAREATRMLNAGATVLTRDGAGVATSERPLAPGDIAVLVRTRTEADLARAALQAAGVPAVFHGGSDVLTTPAAQAWLDLLRAIERPAFVARVRAAALGPFIGWDATKLATASEEDWDVLDELIRDWALALRVHGVTGLLRSVEASQGLTARVLATVGGERQLSDLRHVAELLHADQVAHAGSVSSLASSLADQIRARRGPGQANEVEEGRRRLESDADAVTIQTIHGAKGLEFPVVLLPSLWAGPWAPDDDQPIYHDADGARCIAVGGAGERFQAQAARADAERQQEELRLLYVALTRAEHRVVVWWVTSTDARSSPFARVLYERDGTGAIPSRLRTVPDEAAIRVALGGRSSASDAIAWEDVVVGAPPPRYEAPATAVADLAVAPFARTFDRTWARTSYSGLTAAAHDATPASAVLERVEPDEGSSADEPEEEQTDRPPEGDPLAVVVPLSAVPGGARVGTLVHEVLELVDFTAPDLAVTMAARTAAQGAERLVPGQVGTLVDGLLAAVATPLGPLFQGRSLAQVGRADRLDELAFDLPLGGGDHPAGVVTMAAIADVFATSLDPADPLAGYHERLRDPILTATVRGFLNGSIDLVTRVGPRHVVIDYKTNHLGPRGEPLTAWHYRPEALAVAMADAHYPLQAALYAVALHRYLRWRVAGYDPAVHLGGVAYLFLRGMTGPDGPQVEGAPCGVFSWSPPAAFVVALSDLLDRGAP